MMYTTPTQINGSWREVLIYKSETPLIFDGLDRHHQSDEQGDKTVLTTYVTEPYIYREFAPTVEDNHYYYWFIVKVVEKETVITNGDRVAALESQDIVLEEAMCEIDASTTARINAIEEALCEMDMG